MSQMDKAKGRYEGTGEVRWWPSPFHHILVKLSVTSLSSGLICSIRVLLRPLLGSWKVAIDLKQRRLRIVKRALFLFP